MLICKRAKRLDLHTDYEQKQTAYATLVGETETSCRSR
ncbi:hypothetical protein SAMN05421875_13438 [Acidovorax soli]|jgi:hypothetical protein|uniref:Uncharacterized protein n=1 Tax=Acidovorax soli TaxID=592050 RepID=A0A1H4EEH1_9BURK|nr:hypothetical protein SAMN05421875_13438 [Acidovorax soli]